MPANLVVISEHDADIAAGKAIADENGFVFNHLTTRDDIRTFLVDHPQSLILWDAERAEGGVTVGEMLQSLGLPAGRIFAVTDHPMNAYPHLIKYSVFAHHLLRRFTPPAPAMYSRLVGSAVIPVPFGLLRYFPEGTPSQKITLARSSQKNAAVEAMQRYLEKAGMISRLAALAAQATDELIMNAIFDAPVGANGEPTRRATDRSADFELGHKEQVQVEVASGSEYIGLCVADQFGSLKRPVLMKFLMQDYEKKSYSVWRQDPGAGLGLHAASQSGLSLLFICQPGIRTEVMLFMCKSQNYKDFRSSFRFTSVMMG